MRRVEFSVGSEILTVCSKLVRGLEFSDEVFIQCQ